MLSYLAYDSLGYVGIALMRLALTWLIALTLTRLVHRVTQHFPIAAVLCIATLIAITPMLSYARTWLVSILFFVLTLDTIVRGQRGEPLSRFWWLPLMYILWANTHVQFVFGLWALGTVPRLLFIINRQAAI